MKHQIRFIHQLLFSYLLIIILALSLFSLLTSRSIKQFHIRQNITGLETEARIAAIQIKPLLKAARSDTVDSLCKELGRNTATHITVILPDGTVVGDSLAAPHSMDNQRGRPEIAAALTGEVESAIRYSQTLRHRMLYVAAPLDEKRPPDAVIRTALPLTALDQEIKAVHWQLAASGLIVALLATLLGFLISKRILRPLETMRQGAQRFSAGELDHRMSGANIHELNSLATDMNRMAQELKQRIDTISKQRNRYEAVVSSMDEGVVAVGLEGRILSINQAAVRMLGHGSDNTQGRSLQEVLRNRDLQQFIATAVLTTGTISDDIILHDRDNQVWQLTATPLKGGGKERLGTLLVLNDVTRLRRLERVRKDFVANVSHEIKTPLTAIKGFVETLQDGALEAPQETEQFLQIIARHADRLDAIVSDLLSLSKIEEQAALQLTPSNLGKIIEAAILVCQPGAFAQKITLRYEFDTPVYAAVDERLLEQALVNLIENAVKYSPENGEVRITVKEGAAAIRILVEDDGIGIPQKDQPRIFERFYRVDRARSRHMGGTGLGLAIVKHIVTLHGGHVSVESELGHGSRFTIHLPNGVSEAKNDYTK